jgi:hypothetical protein
MVLFVLTDLVATTTARDTYNGTPYLRAGAVDAGSNPQWIVSMRLIEHTQNITISVGDTFKTRSLTGMRLVVQATEKLYIASRSDVEVTWSGFRPY